MNLAPTEIERLTIFTAAELARRYRSLGIKLSHPEAVALITDEVMTAARRDIPYAEIRDMASRLLTTDDVEPGVADMVSLIYIECNFAEGTKVIALFEPIGPGRQPITDALVPGEIVSPDATIEMFADQPKITLDVLNTGDRDIQVRSHTHFFEVNKALRFDRASAWGMKIDRPAGTGIRFEPGVSKTVSLVPIGGSRIVRGQAGLVDGALDDPQIKAAAMERARRLGYLEG